MIWQQYWYQPVLTGLIRKIKDNNVYSMDTIHDLPDIVAPSYLVVPARMRRKQCLSGRVVS